MLWCLHNIQKTHKAWTWTLIWSSSHWGHVQRLYNQKLSNETHHVSYHSTFLGGLGIKSLGYTSIFDVHCRVHRSAPKFKSQPLCKNHVFCTFHDGSIGTFRNIILLWGIGRTCLLINSTFHKKCVKLLRHKFSFVAKS